MRRHRASATKIRLVCIGDAHDSPAIPDKSRFARIARYIRAVTPDVVVQIGDFATFDSVSVFHRDTSEKKGKPTFAEDLASFEAALSALEIRGPARHCTLGNHEQRVRALKYRSQLERAFKARGWSFSPYGEVVYYGGVGFVHTPLNRLSKPYSGRGIENAIADDAVHDLVIGHSHRECRIRAPKIGGNNSVQIINVGCALPDGYVEPYARHGLTGWSYGIANMTIRAGHVQDYQFISMANLDERYANVKA